MICCYDSSLESQNLLMIKDLFKLKTDLNFSELIFKTHNGSVFSLNINLIFLTTKLICIFIKYRSDYFKTQN